MPPALHQPEPEERRGRENGTDLFPGLFMQAQQDKTPSNTLPMCQTDWLISAPMPPMKFTGSYCPIVGLKNKPLNRAKKKPEI
jgi:hypothetical protein